MLRPFHVLVSRGLEEFEDPGTEKPRRLSSLGLCRLAHAVVRLRQAPFLPLLGRCGLSHESGQVARAGWIQGFDQRLVGSTAAASTAAAAAERRG